MKEAVVCCSPVVSLKTRNGLCIQYLCIYQHKCTGSNKIKIKVGKIKKQLAYFIQHLTRSYVVAYRVGYSYF